MKGHYEIFANEKSVVFQIKNHDFYILSKLIPAYSYVSVLMIKTENCQDICFSFVNSMTYPLIMYDKFV